jgi:outer membrane PBP1 activator LpoA protein
MRCGELHRRLLAGVLIALLYGAAAASASEAMPAARAAAEPGAPQGEPLEPAVPHVALLMPARSSGLAKAAEAVTLGFTAAAKTDAAPTLPIRVYGVAGSPESAILEYRRAVANGARLVIGPLTRDAVTALASRGRITVPTLALNVPDGDYPLPPRLYVLSLHVEAEAAQVAQLAIADGRQRALTVAAGTPLLRRVHQAFVEAFRRLGGRIVEEYAYDADPTALATLRKALRASGADMAFLALDYAEARLVRPYLGALPAYATSQIHPGQAAPPAGHDLGGVRFLDMPWLLQPDHAAVMLYPRSQFGQDADLERLYALGIDACRIGAALLKGDAVAALDGVTGQLRLEPDHRYARMLTGAEFSEGRLLSFARNEPPR